jgi:hypothetical protein
MYYCYYYYCCCCYYYYYYYLHLGPKSGLKKNSTWVPPF